MRKHADTKDKARGDPQPVLAPRHPSVEPAPGPSLPPAASLVAHDFSAIPVVPEGSLDAGLAPTVPDPAPASAGGDRVRPPSLHPKRVISQPGDPPEEAADRAAEQVLGGAVLQRKPAGGEAQVTAPAGSGGQQLDPATRAFMEPRFGFDFSRVRIHADAEASDAARSVDAHAYTVGSDIVFGAGRYAPESVEG